MLYPRQERLLAIHERINKFFIDLCPSLLSLRILRFAALFHSECKANLEELSVLGKPYTDMLNNLEVAIKANADLTTAILKSDNKLFLAPPTPKQILDTSKSIGKTCEGFLRIGKKYSIIYSKNS